MAINPFGDDDTAAGPRRTNPFADDDGDLDPIERIGHSARKIRSLRTQMGAEGLTLSATRVLIDELSKSLDATAQALAELRASK